MKQPRKKVGLALGSGAARGLAHIGVLEVLEKDGIPVDMISGTSMGALIGALYAQGVTANSIRKLALEVRWIKLLSLLDLTFPRSGLIAGNRLKTSLRSFFGRDVQFSDLKIPFACVSTDIFTGERVVIKEGSVLEAVRASISIPGVFTLVEYEGRYLADGGLSDPVPVGILRTMGADVVVAVNVIPRISMTDRTYWTKRGSGRSKEPSIVEVLLQSIYIGNYSIAESSAKRADLVIEPKVAHINPTDFENAGECIFQGELAALEALPKLKSLLEV